MELRFYSKLMLMVVVGDSHDGPFPVSHLFCFVFVYPLCPAASRGTENSDFGKWESYPLALHDLNSFP